METLGEMKEELGAEGPWPSVYEKLQVKGFSEQEAESRSPGVSKGCVHCGYRELGRGGQVGLGEPCLEPGEQAA